MKRLIGAAQLDSGINKTICLLNVILGPMVMLCYKQKVHLEQENILKSFCHDKYKCTFTVKRQERNANNTVFISIKEKELACVKEKLMQDAY